MRIPWQVNTVAAAACSGVGLADLALHEWWGVPVLATSAGLNVWVSHRNYGRQHPPEAPHRPDYAKIRRLEIELGLGDPDLPVPRPPPLGVTIDPPSKVRPSYPPKYQYQPQEAEAPPPVSYPQEWTYCRVCTRRHAGRCAG